MHNATIRVSKLGAARRQLDAALSMWFLDWDTIATHTVAHAAHEIIQDIHNKRAAGKEMFFDSAVIKDEYRKEFADIFKKPGNFFKHADRAPDEILDFSPDITTIFLLYSIVGLQNLGEQPSAIAGVYVSWLALHKPRYVNSQILDLFSKNIPANTLDEMRRLDKREFLETMLQARTRIRA